MEGHSLSNQTKGNPDAHQSNQQNQRNDHQTGQKMVEIDFQHEHFNTDQNKEDSIEDLIDELPEGIEIFARGLRHRKGTAVVADQQSGRDDGQRTGGVQSVRKIIAAHHQAQGDEHLHLIIVHAFEHLIGDPADSQSYQDSTESLFGKQQGGLADGDTGSSGSDAHQNNKKHQCEQHQSNGARKMKV